VPHRPLHRVPAIELTLDEALEIRRNAELDGRGGRADGPAAVDPGQHPALDEVVNDAHHEQRAAPCRERVFARSGVRPVIAQKMFGYKRAAAAILRWTRR
jgi:hypothetical protein